MEYKCVEFTIYYQCNVDCVFCSHTVRMEHFADSPIPVGEIVDKLKEKRKDGFNHVTFTGGEPTLYPGFAKLLEICRLLGYRTRAVSNGWPFSSEEYAKKTLPYLDELCLSIHGADSKSHDYMTGAKGGYLKMKRALETVCALKPDIKLIVNSVATSKNVDELAAIASWVSRHEPVSEYWISTLVAQGAGWDRFKELSLPNREVMARASEIVRAAGRVPVRFYGFPLCVLGQYRGCSTDVGRNPAVAVYRGRKKDGTTDIREMESKKTDPPHVKPSVCSDCGASSHCGGLWREYYRLYGDSELTPLRSEVAA